MALIAAILEHHIPFQLDIESAALINKVESFFQSGKRLVLDALLRELFDSVGDGGMMIDLNSILKTLMSCPMHYVVHTLSDRSCARVKFLSWVGISSPF